ncbi:MAG TPA: AAA family ATPase [Thermoleophilaceae bacterium]
MGALDSLGCLPAHIDGRQNGRLRLMVRCPVHDDHSPSLSVEHIDDRTLVHCFAGCEAKSVVETLGLDWRDLFDESYERLNALSAPKDFVRADNASDLPFTLMGDVIANVPAEPEWAWDGYSAPGTVALFAGRPKVGKSTLTFGLIAAMLNGRPFAGRKRAAAACCY